MVKGCSQKKELITLKHHSADCNAKFTKDMALTTTTEKEKMRGVPYQEVVGSLLYEYDACPLGCL